MTKFTKEQLIEIAQENVDAWHLAMEIDSLAQKEYAAIRLHVAEIALATLAAPTEPVYQCEFCHHDSSGELQWHWEDVNKEFYEQYDPDHRGKRRVLYAAPQLPQPAVPQRVPESLKLRLITIGDVVEDTNEYCQDIWNACRAAMLQGAEPVQSWIPCSERMPKIGTRVLTCDVERSGVYEAIRFDKNRFNRFGCEIIADYWQPLPAAPQQEV